MHKNDCCELNSDERGLYFKCGKERETKCVSKSSVFNASTIGMSIVNMIAFCFGWYIGQCIVEMFK